MLLPLTSLRFVFALMVFVSHCVIFLPGGEAAHPTIYGIIHEGFIGVSFFFVLSGFILAYRYPDAEQTAPRNVRKFWIRRLARIYPVYLFCLLFSAGLHFQYLQRDPPGFFRDLGLHMSMLQVIVDGGKHAFMFNGPAWSVADVMIFYLLFPLLIRLSSRLKLWIILVCLSAALVMVALYLSPDPTFGMFYRNPVVRLVDFAMGILLFRLYEIDRRAWSRSTGTIMEFAAILILAAFMLSRNVVPEHWHYSVYYWIPILFLIYTFAKGAGLISSWLSKRPAVQLGEASYAFYLFHIPAAIFLPIVLRRLGLSLSPMGFIACYFVFVLVSSFMLFHFLERPLNRFLRRRLISSREELQKG